MKQKVVIKVSLNGHASRFFCFGTQSSRSKVLRLAGGFPGVESVALVNDLDRIEVTGEIDVVKLTTLLRKKVRVAEIMSVGEAKKEDESKEKDAQPVACMYPRHEIFYVMDR